MNSKASRIRRRWRPRLISTFHPVADGLTPSPTMESPHTAPKAAEPDTSGIARSKRLLGWAAILCGLGVVIPPLPGLAGAIKGMAGAFAELDRTGSADPSALAGEISLALLTLFWGLAFSALSTIPFIVCSVLFLKRRKSLHSLGSPEVTANRVEGSP